MTQRELMFLFMGFVFGCVVNQNRKAHDAGKELPREFSWKVVFQLLPTGFFAGLAVYAAVVDLILVCIAFRMLLGGGDWEPDVLFAIPIAGAASGFFAWAAVRLGRDYNRRRLGFEPLTVLPLRTAKEKALYKSTPHDLA